MSAGGEKIQRRKFKHTGKNTLKFKEDIDDGLTLFRIDYTRYFTGKIYLFFEFVVYSFKLLEKELRKWKYEFVTGLRLKWMVSPKEKILTPRYLEDDRTKTFIEWINFYKMLISKDMKFAEIKEKVLKGKLRWIQSQIISKVVCHVGVIYPYKEPFNEVYVMFKNESILLEANTLKEEQILEAFNLFSLISHCPSVNLEHWQILYKVVYITFYLNGKNKLINRNYF